MVSSSVAARPASSPTCVEKIGPRPAPPLWVVAVVLVVRGSTHLWSVMGLSRRRSVSVRKTTLLGRPSGRLRPIVARRRPRPTSSACPILSARRPARPLRAPGIGLTRAPRRRSGPRSRPGATSSHCLLWLGCGSSLYVRRAALCIGQLAGLFCPCVSGTALQRRERRIGGAQLRTRREGQPHDAPNLFGPAAASRGSGGGAPGV